MAMHYGLDQMYCGQFLFHTGSCTVGLDCFFKKSISNKYLFKNSILLTG